MKPQLHLDFVQEGKAGHAVDKWKKRPKSIENRGKDPTNAKRRKKLVKGDSGGMEGLERNIRGPRRIWRSTYRREKE